MEELKKIFIELNKDRIFAKPEDDTERTSDDGKARSIFFTFILVRINKDFIKNDSNIIIGFDHKNYSHFSQFTEESKKELSNDFDI